MIKDKGFYVDFIKLTLPLLIQQVVTFLVQMLDTVMVGALGDEAVSAVTIANQPYFIFSVFVFGLTSGGAIIISQYWGKNDLYHIRKTIGFMMSFVLIITILYMIVCYMFPYQILSIFSRDHALVSQGVSYLKTVIWGYLLNAIATCYFVSLSAKENVKISTYVYMVALVINFFANQGFIFGRFGLPALGVTGAAVGTVIARGFETIIAIGYAKFFEKDIKFSITDLFELDLSLVPQYFKTSFLVLVDDLIWSLNASAQLIVIGAMSSNYITAASIGNIAQNFSLIICYAIARASSIVIGKIIGSGDYEYAKKAANTFMIIGVFVGLFTCGVTLLIREPIFYFYPNVSEYTKNITREIINALAVIAIATGLDNISIVGIFRGAGDSKFAFWIDMICMWGIGFTMGCLGAFVWKLPIVYVYFLLRCDTFVKIIIASIRVKNGKFIHDVTLKNS